MIHNPLYYNPFSPKLHEGLMKNMDFVGNTHRGTSRRASFDNIQHIRFWRRGGKGSEINIPPCNGGIFINLFYIIALFGDIIIRYRIRSRIPIPTTTFGYLTPLFLCSAIVYARKRGVISERISTNACDTLGDGYAR